MADVLYPSVLLAHYKDIRLLCDGRIVSVAVNRYRNTKPEAGGTRDAEDVKDALINVTSGRVKEACGGAGPGPMIAIYQQPSGKGFVYLTKPPIPKDGGAGRPATIVALDVPH